MSDMTIDDIRDRLSGERVAMLTTVDPHGTLSSRPLAIQSINDHGDVFFLVAHDADWVDLSGDEAANVAIVDEGTTWLSVAGRLRFSNDSMLLDELWDERSAAYFPNGKGDAAVAHVVSNRWEYWTSPTTAAHVIEFVKAKLTDQAPDLGSSGTIET